MTFCFRSNNPRQALHQFNQYSIETQPKYNQNVFAPIKLSYLNIFIAIEAFEMRVTMMTTIVYALFGSCYECLLMNWLHGDGISKINWSVINRLEWNAIALLIWICKIKIILFVDFVIIRAENWLWKWNIKIKKNQKRTDLYRVYNIELNRCEIQLEMIFIEMCA